MGQVINMPQDPRYAAMREALLGSISQITGAMKQKSVADDYNNLMGQLVEQYPELQGMAGLKNPQVGMQMLPNIIDLIKANKTQPADTGKISMIQGDGVYWKYNDKSGDYEKTEIPVPKKDSKGYSDPITPKSGPLSGVTYQKDSDGKIVILKDPTDDKSGTKTTQQLNNISTASRLIASRWKSGSKGISIGSDGSVDLGGGADAVEEMRKAAADKNNKRNKQAIKDLYDYNNLIDRAKGIVGLSGDAPEAVTPQADYVWDPAKKKLVPAKK